MCLQIEGGVEVGSAAEEFGFVLVRRAVVVVLVLGQALQGLKHCCHHIVSVERTHDCSTQHVFNQHGEQ